MDTIFALSSGSPPAGIGVIRITGDAAAEALRRIAGSLPKPRMATRATFRDADGNPLDDGLVIYFPAPRSVTGEDVAELHCHGGRAVVAAIKRTLGEIEGCRRAEPGEFTRRAFANARIDLSEAEGLADLLLAETELQRQSAMAMAGGAFSRQIDGWRDSLLKLSAQVEATLDFDDEDDVGEVSDAFSIQVSELSKGLHEALDAPHAETLKEGFRVALAGPPNAGKSTLFNALVESEAAITAEIAGTTRDVLSKSVAIRGVPFTFVDMAGLRNEAGDEIEAIGIKRAQAELEKADLVLWLGEEGEGPADSWEIEARVDTPDRSKKHDPRLRISAKSGEGMAILREQLISRARDAMPKPGEIALSARQRELLAKAANGIEQAAIADDPLIMAEDLRTARSAIDALTGQTATEDVLDTLFGRFCIGK
ncbi:tRNA uridine-5-carboxymethylaminomethyl(34) synthesis GTPase MnmE [Aurantiacibacter aquimixticola]|uniref:tRNA modification GTPase MnmE n=1 Tax=Aurantiacibacter aquimixticola TaxID=1958945 RepID=A0A419RUW7_9SPHN|nr:tRNA uridine-5-carboxymethylaminomethyl(34) synthesis GTPase MnmE [Aurantiacibacter aquimixticola]RJY09579.1 tRNA uridine-5-carboxymethylaminomethyl(34) synthesis GTPase MnmE [Aurantiacibacter aquimixticola]